MTLQEWKAQWRRLDQFRVSGDVDRDQVSAEWFGQLKHWHVDAVDHGITRLIGSAEDTFLPGLGRLKLFIQERFDRYDRAPGKCANCSGSGWVEARPMKWDGRIYEMNERCPACGIPAPVVKPHPGCVPVTDVEWHEWKAGRYARDTMPEWAKAKPVSDEKRIAQREDFRKWADALRVRLFGNANESDAA